MDDSASLQEPKEIRSLFLQIQNSNFPTQRQVSSIKYTKLPDFDFDMKVLWPQKDSYVLQPRLRRIVTLNDQENILRMSRSLRSELGVPFNLMSTYTKRKIATISEVEENEPLPVSKDGMKKMDITQKSHKTVSSSNDTVILKTRSASSEPSRYVKKLNIRPQSAKSSNSSRNKSLSASKVQNKTSNSDNAPTTQQSRDSKFSIFREKDKSRNIIPTDLQKNSTTKQFKHIAPCEKKSSSRNKSENLKSTVVPKMIAEKPKSPPKSGDVSKSRKSPAKLKQKPLSPLIQVPLNDVVERIDKTMKSDAYSSSSPDIKEDVCIPLLEDRHIGTDPEPQKVDVITQMEPENLMKTDSCIQTEKIEIVEQNLNFGNLDIPNVTLSKDRSDLTHTDVFYQSSILFSPKTQSLPELQVPSMKISPRRDNDRSKQIQYSKNESFIIGRATLTYTTEQKIDFHVVGKKEQNVSNSSSSSHLGYPLTVMSAYKNELKKKKVNESREDDEEKRKNKLCHIQSLSTSKSLDCSYGFNRSKLVKPSELISTIRVNSDLLQGDYICEQFQRELNFIDSFIESLQYLENCSLSNNILSNDKVERLTNSGFDLQNPEYNSFFSKFTNGATNDDSETMASKSLCLLNLLIRDEQRRAKNLLFVLKMREDALKDFTKSQILWLENKKKQDNTDISTLKKKQRGALLKLQHECGEMQRMRKALLSLSEKRKVALMKTKKNIELKLKNNVTVEHILLSKKKIKRNLHDRSIAPLKCFDLSSSGCDDSTTSRAKSDSALVIPEVLMATNVQSIEKSIQTGDSLLSPPTIDHSTDTTAENFVAVDGSYLNILFHNLSLPEIFSGGKNYEVNEEALKVIVVSANSNRSAANTGLVEKFIEQIKNRDENRSTSPSTARSLVEELDQYYKGFTEEDKSHEESLEKNINDEVKPIDSRSNNISEAKCTESESQVSSVSEPAHVELMSLVDEDPSESNRETLSSRPPAGPLPVPAGAVAAADSAGSRKTLTTVSSYSNESVNSVMSSISTPAHNEAEELLRQQLAIEREIKALEQQQCQLLVVREIPDKPPPPYTPPAEARSPRSPRMYLVDDTIEEKVRRKVNGGSTESTESNSAFELFLEDFCEDSVQKYKAEQSDEPWDACNLLPQKPPLDTEHLVEKISADLKDVLTGVTPTVVSGVGARKSDHIDDILFAEWRRCEPEWTALHTEEAQVKSQLFEAIFQRVLTDTIDEYKKTVLSCDTSASEVRDELDSPPKNQC